MFLILFSSSYHKLSWTAVLKMLKLLTLSTYLSISHVFVMNHF